MRLLPRTLSSTFILVILLVACEYEKRPVPLVPDIVSFAVDILPRFESRCAISDCHDGVTSATTPINPILTADTAYKALWDGGYIDTANPGNSVLYKAVYSGDMYQNATDEDRAVILEWIKEGAKNN